MEIKKIELEGFKSYKSYNKIDLPHGIAGIIGVFDTNSNRSNGTGKSSLVNSIIYTHFGEGEYERVADLMNDDPSTTSMFVRVTEIINGNEYVIERGIKNKSSYLDLYENGIKIGDNMKSSQEAINSILGMDYDMFTASVFSEQSNMDKFINTTPDKLRGYIDKILGLELWRTLGKNSATNTNTTKKEITDTKNKIEVVLQKISEAKLSIKDTTILKSEIEKLSKKRDALQEIINSYVVHNENFKKLEEEKYSLKGIKRKLDEVDDILSKLNIDQLKSNLEQKVECNSLEIKNLNEFITSNEEVLINYQNQKSDIVTTINDFSIKTGITKNSISSKEKSLTEIISGKCPKCHQEVNISLLEEENNFVKKEIDGLKIQLQDLVENTKNKNNSLQLLENDIQNVTKDLIKAKQDIKKHETDINNLKLELSNSVSKYEAQVTRRVELLEFEIKCSNSIKDLKDKLQGVDTNITNKILDLSREFANYSKDIESLNRDLGDAIRSEKYLKELTEDEKNLKNTLKNKEKQIIIYNTLGELFKAIPGQVLEESLEFIKDYSNEIIKQIIPGLSVEIYEDDSKAKKPLVISFLKNNRPRTYKSLSGGERVAVNIGIRLGFSKVITNKAKTYIGLIVLDEPFGELDSENRNLVKKILSVLAENFNQILIISHTDDITDFPNIITVRKNKDDVSYIN